MFNVPKSKKHENNHSHTDMGRWGAEEGREGRQRPAGEKRRRDIDILLWLKFKKVKDLFPVSLFLISLMFILRYAVILCD